MCNGAVCGVAIDALGCLRNLDTLHHYAVSCNGYRVCCAAVCMFLVGLIPRVLTKMTMQAWCLSFRGSPPLEVVPGKAFAWCVV